MTNSESSKRPTSTADAANAGVRRVSVSVVAPCFNEQDNLTELERRTAEACRAVVGEDFEIVLVNDGSIDATWSGIQDLVRTRPNITGVNLSRNFGHQLALSAGLSVARGDRVLIIDADLQDDPAHLAAMMKLMDDGADIVYGQRTLRHGDGSIRRAASTIFYRMLHRLADVEIPVDTGDFRLINRRALDALLAMPEHHRFIRGMISWVGFKQVPFTYERDSRAHGETGYSISRLFSFAVDGITGFSIRPLRYVTVVGFGAALLGLVYFAYIFSNWVIHGSDVAGWPSLMAVILLMSGVQLVSVGIVGEYVGRIFQQVKNRPLFIISDIVSSNRSDT